MNLLNFHIIVCALSKKVGNDQESIQSSTTPDPGYHMGKTHEQQRSYGDGIRIILFFLLYVWERGVHGCEYVDSFI